MQVSCGSLVTFSASSVSISLYYHGSPGLQLVEKHNILMTWQYVMESGKGIDVVYSKVVEVAGNARKCYAEGSTPEFDDEAFAPMMFLAGCFILQFMYCTAKNNCGVMGMKSHAIAFMHRDMFLLENQLPFLVLKALMSLRFKEDGEKDIINTLIGHTRALSPLGTTTQEKLSRFIPISIWGQEALQSKPQKDEGDPVHLLELVRAKLIDVLKKLETGPHSSSDWYSYRSSKELSAVGVHFKPGKTHLYTDVTFKPSFLSGKLTLPPITVDDSTQVYSSKLGSI